MKLSKHAPDAERNASHDGAVEFGRIVRAAREAAGRSLADVARHMGLSIQYVADVERATRAPFAQDRLPAVARLLDIPLGRLMDAAAKHERFWRLPVTGVPEQDRLASFFAQVWMKMPLEQVREISAVVDCACDGCSASPPRECYSEDARTSASAGRSSF